MGKTLLRNTIVDGVLYGPDGKEPTGDVLDAITNPNAFRERPVGGITDGIPGADDDDHPGDEPGAGHSGADGDGELKGRALDKALKDAGLPVTGSAAEKRAALAEHQADAGS